GRRRGGAHRQHGRRGEERLEGHTRAMCPASSTTRRRSGKAITMRKLRDPASVSRTPIASNLLPRMNRKRILGDPRLSAPDTVHETPETLQATVAGIREFEGLHPTH